MEYFLIKRYQACIDALQGGSDAVGEQPCDTQQRRCPERQPLDVELNPIIWSLVGIEPVHAPLALNNGLTVFLHTCRQLESP